MKFGFEGGQTPLRRRLPKRGFKNKFKLHFQPVGLGKIAKLINAGQIDSHELITMKMLKDVGEIEKQIEDGVRLMGRGADEIKWPLHFEVSRVTVRAKELVEAAGGSVRRLYYNKLGHISLLSLGTALAYPLDTIIGNPLFSLSRTILAGRLCSFTSNLNADPATPTKLRNAGLVLAARKGAFGALCILSQAII